MSIALRQDKHAATNSINFSSATAAGSLLVLVITGFVSSSTGPGITINTPSTSGFSWTLAQNPSYGITEGVTGHFTYISGEVNVYYIQNASSMSSATSTTVSVTGDAATPTVDMRLYEFTGCAASSVVDTSGNGNNSSNTSTTMTAGNLTTANTDLIFCASTFTSPSGDGSGYTAGVVTGDQYILNQSAGTISTSYGIASAQWAVAAVAFKSGAANVTPTGVSATFSFRNPTVHAGAAVTPTKVSALFGLGVWFVPQPGVGNPIPVRATFAVANNITAGIPINYGNVVAGSNAVPGGINSTYFYARFTGFLTVSTPGKYTFGLNVQDGGDLYIGTQPIVKTLATTLTANSVASYNTSTVTVELAANILYPIVAEWQHGTGSNYECQVLWTPPGQTAPTVIPSSNLRITGYWWNGNSSLWYPTTWY